MVIFNIPKIIHLTHKHEVPKYVLDAIRTLNPGYTIEFSLDRDCVQFLKKHYNDDVAKLFNMIFKGMHKADLWRLCKLYICGGIYMDVDLVPLVAFDAIFARNKHKYSMYTCRDLSSQHIFQALMMCTPKHPLILSAIHRILSDDSLFPHISANHCLPTVSLGQTIREHLHQETPNMKPGIELRLQQMSILHVRRVGSLSCQKNVSLFTNLSAYTTVHTTRIQDNAVPIVDGLSSRIIAELNHPPTELSGGTTVSHCTFKRVDRSTGWAQSVYYKINVCDTVNLHQNNLYLFDERLVCPTTGKVLNTVALPITLPQIKACYIYDASNNTQLFKSRYDSYADAVYGNNTSNEWAATKPSPSLTQPITTSTVSTGATVSKTQRVKHLKQEIKRTEKNRRKKNRRKKTHRKT